MNLALSESGDPSSSDFKLISSTFATQLKDWKEAYDRSARELTAHTPPDERRGQTWARARMTLGYNVARLVLHAPGFQNALVHHPTEVLPFFISCNSAATAINDYGVEGLRCAPDSLLVFLLYAGLSLLTYCRPRVQKLHDASETIMESVETLVSLFESAGSGRPNSFPAQYGKLLRHIVRVQESGGMATRHPSRAPSPVPQDDALAFGAEEWGFTQLASQAPPERGLLDPFLPGGQQGGFGGFGVDDSMMDVSFFPIQNQSLTLAFDGLLDDINMEPKMSYTVVVMCLAR
ncbi:hypothetical protein RQP46_011244 [Phenoliferia psychrophenolica]